MSLAMEMQALANARAKPERPMTLERAESLFEQTRSEEERHWVGMIQIAAKGGHRSWINYLGEVTDPYTRIAERACVMLMSAHGFRCERGSTNYRSEESGEYMVCRHVRVMW